MNAKTVSVFVLFTILFATTLGVFAVSTANAQTTPTCNIYATTVSTGPGTPVTLTWNSTNATSAVLSPGGSVATNGTQVVYPNVTTTYTLSVYSSQGYAGTCQTTVAVGGTSGAPSCTIYANPSSIGSTGGTSMLTWNSSNATSATLTNVGSVSTSGSQSMSPSYTTTYTLTVYNAQGQSSNCQTTVSVGTTYQAPSCWITLTPQYGQYSNQATLSWGSTNSTSANINPSIGSVSTSGSQTIYNYYSGQIYTMTVYNAQGQSATCQTSYIPSGAISCTITANPVNIQNGSSSYLSWTSTGAASAYLNDGLGNVAPNGSITVRPESSRNYILTVIGSNGAQQTCTTFLSVSGSYIHLNQIPYTGFDLGPIGNTMYWFALALFAVAGGYLIAYHLPRRRHAGVSSARLQANHNHYVEEATIISETVTTPALFANTQPEFITEAPVRAEAPENLPTFRS